MNSFYGQLQALLAQYESERRGVLFLIVIVLLESHLASWRTTLIVAGLCLMFEGWAMLAGRNNPKNGRSAGS